MSVLNWFKERGWFSLLNLAFVGMLLSLVYNLIFPATASATQLVVYQKRYWAVIVVVLLAAGISVYLIQTGSRRFNRILGLFFIAAFAVAEVGLRRVEKSVPFRIHHRSPVPYVMFTGDPGGTMKDAALNARMGNPDSDGTIQLNELGYRGPVPPADKGDEYRILVLGESCVFDGSELSKTFPGWLETMFHRRGHDNVRVYNWGVISCCSGQQLATLVHRGLDYDPDMVIAYNGPNDFIGPYYYDPRPGYPFNYMLTEAHQRFAEYQNATVDLLAALLQPSRVLSFAFGDVFSRRLVDLPGLREQCSHRTPEWEQRLVDAYTNHMLKMSMIG